MKWLKKWFARYVKLGEETLPLGHLLTGFGAMLILENFLEIFSDPQHIPLKRIPFPDELFLNHSFSIAIWLIHCLLWWLVCAGGFAIIIAAAVRKTPVKTARFVLSLGWFLPIVPIVDLVLSGGKGIDIHYINPAAGLTAFMDSTPGETVCSVLFFAAAAAYARLNNTPVKRILAAYAGMLAVMLLLFTMPAWIKPLFDTVGVPRLSGHPLIITRLLLIALWLETAVFLVMGRFIEGRYFSKRDLAGLAGWLFLFVLGMAIYRRGLIAYAWTNLASLILSLLVIVNIWFLFHAKRTAASGAKPLPPVFFPIVAALTVLCAIAINYLTLYILGAAAALIALGLTDPYRIILRPLAEKFLYAALTLLAIFTGYQFAQGDILDFPRIFILFFLVVPGLLLNLLDLEPVREGSLASLLGAKAAAIFCALVWSCSAISLPFLLIDPLMLTITIPVGALGAWLILRRARTTSLLTLIALTLALIIIRLSF